MKLEGNNHFRSKAWEEALAQYKSALGHLPRREPEPPQEPVEPPEPSDPDAVGISTPETSPATPPQPKNEESPEVVKARAVLNANVGACYVQLVGRPFCVTVPCLKYTRRRESTKRSSKHARRVGPSLSQCTRQTRIRLIGCPDSPGGRSMLCQSTPTTSCLERNHRVVVCADQCSRRYDDEPEVAFLTLMRSTDYRMLLSLLPESSTQWSEINRTLRNLEPRVEKQRKEEMGEMMGKLKELGNTVLGSPHNTSPWGAIRRNFTGNFGLSTDNFKFEPNGQGGYSVNFSR